jgi:hypothetical protein
VRPHGTPHRGDRHERPLAAEQFPSGGHHVIENEGRAPAAAAHAAGAGGGCGRRGAVHKERQWAQHAPVKEEGGGHRARRR